MSKKLLKNRPRASAILTTIFLLFGIFVVAMIGINIVMNGLNARRAQGASAKAFYGAESGAERAMNQFKLYGSLILADDGCKQTAKKLKLDSKANPFCGDDTLAPYDMRGVEADPSAKYWVKEKNNGHDVTVNARGNFANTSRELYLSFCLPDCSNNTDDDGCGGKCK